jgi:hypothetical protein
MTGTVIEAIKRLIENVRRHSGLSGISRDADCIFQDIITAMRGPDSVSHNLLNASEMDELKDLTTARIRGIVGIEQGHGLIVNSLPLSEIQIERRNLLLESFGSYHFAAHIKAAYSALGILGYDFPKTEKETLKTDQVIVV